MNITTFNAKVDSVLAASEPLPEIPGVEYIEDHERRQCRIAFVEPPSMHERSVLKRNGWTWRSGAKSWIRPLNIKGRASAVQVLRLIELRRNQLR